MSKTRPQDMDKDGRNKVNEEANTDILLANTSSESYQLKAKWKSPESLKPYMTALEPKGRLELFEYLVDAVLKDTQSIAESSTVALKLTPLQQLGFIYTQSCQERSKEKKEPDSLQEQDLSQVAADIDSINTSITELQSDTRELQSETRIILANLSKVVAEL